MPSSGHWVRRSEPVPEGRGQRGDENREIGVLQLRGLICVRERPCCVSCRKSPVSVYLTVSKTKLSSKRRVNERRLMRSEALSNGDAGERT